MSKLIKAVLTNKKRLSALSCLMESPLVARKKQILGLEETPRAAHFSGYRKGL